MTTHNNDINNNNCIQRRNSRFFHNRLVAPRTVSNTYAQVARRIRVQITCNSSSAYHVQHTVLYATWYEGTAQLLNMTVLKSHLFELYFIGWTNNRCSVLLLKPIICSLEFLSFETLNPLKTNCHEETIEDNSWDVVVCWLLNVPATG